MRPACLLVLALVAFAAASGPCDNIAITSFENFPVTVYGSTATVTNNTYSCTSSWTLGPATVYYTVTAAADGIITATTCNPATTFDTVLTVINSTSTCTTAKCQDQSDSDNCQPPGGIGTASSISFVAASRQMYWIAVSGYNGAHGPFALTVSFSGLQGCTGASVLNGPYNPPKMVSSSTDGAATYPLLGCPIDYPTKWYKVTPPNTNTITLALSGAVGLQMNVQTDCTECPLSTMIAQSEVTFVPVQAQVYYVGVYNPSGPSSFNLNVSQVPDNLGCQKAIGPIFVTAEEQGLQGFVGSGSVVLDEDVCGASGPAQWYYFTSTVQTAATFTTCNQGTNFDTVLAAYTGSGCQSLQCVQKNDDSSSCSLGSRYSTLTIAMSPNIVYYLSVSGYGSSGTGQYVLSYEST